MSSDILASLRMNDYVSVMVVTAVIYDYLLVFPREIQYVWRKPWTWISTTFVLVRYVGLTWAIINGLYGSAFIPGPITLYPEGTITSLVIAWVYPIFLAAADLVMILRVYALWNRSKTTLYILLFIYVAQIIVSFVWTGIYDNPNTHLSVTVIKVLDVTFCNASYVNTPPLISLYIELPRFLLGAVLIFLAVISTLKQSIYMYKATKQWQPNRYVELFVKDGILYFLVNACINVTSVIETSVPSTSQTTWIFFLGSFGEIAICNMAPRLLIDVRELYDRDLHGRWQGIDTGFGVVSQSFASQNTVISELAFANINSSQGQGVEVDAD